LAIYYLDDSLIPLVLSLSKDGLTEKSQSNLRESALLSFYDSSP
jgi:hypothetical protein